MDQKLIQIALEIVAANAGISVEEVLQEIESAMAIARSNPDPKIQATWEHMPHKGEVVTPEEMIGYIATQFLDNETK